MSTIKKYRDHLHTHGWVLIKGFINHETALEWAERARAGVKVRQDHEGSGEEHNLDEGGAYHHGIANAFDTKNILPEIFGVYASLPQYLSALWNRPVITSPYESSQVTLKVYDKAGDGQGWHKDTNPVTALLILTDTHENYGTLVEGRDGQPFNLINDAGDLYLMYGRELRHSVPSVPEGKWRVTVPMNYYHPDDTWRPADMDDVVYGM